MKKYIVNNAFFNKNQKTEMTEQEYNKWLRVNALAHYGYFRVVGDETSGHFYVDFDEMWEVTVDETDEDKGQGQSNQVA